jgi:hypothetical protein
MRAKSQHFFRRAAKPGSKTAGLFCHLFMAMRIGRMMEKSFAAKPVVWQRNQSQPRLISPSDGHYSADGAQTASYFRVPLLYRYQSLPADRSTGRLFWLYQS